MPCAEKGVHDDRYCQARGSFPGTHHQGRPALHEARESGAGTLQRTDPTGVRQSYIRAVFQADGSLGRLEPVVRVFQRLRTKKRAFLGYPAAKGQQLCRARAGRQAAGAAFRLRNGTRCAPLRARGQLCTGAHHPAAGRHRGPPNAGLTSLSIHAPGTVLVLAGSRTTRRSVWRCAKVIPSTS